MEYIDLVFMVRLILELGGLEANTEAILRGKVN